MNKLGIIICYLLMSPDRIIQAVNTILTAVRTSNPIVLSGWLSQINPIILRLFRWRSTFTTTFS
jgi:hypothetical protein